MAYNMDHLKTNKQFMIGNGILVFAVLVVVSLFIYLSFREQAKKQEHAYAETYTVTLAKGFEGRTLQLLMNDSVLFEGKVGREPLQLQVRRFAQQTSLLFVDPRSEAVSIFELGEQGGEYRFECQGEEVRQLPKVEK